MIMNKMTQVLSHTQSQTQELALKPQMLQSLKMLSLPMLELEMHIKQEIVENPLLEMNEEEEEDETVLLPEESLRGNEEINSTVNEIKELSEILDDWNEYHEERSSQSDDDTDYTQLIKEEDNLKQEFIEVIEHFQWPENEYDYAFELIENVNAYGYLPEDYDIYATAREYVIDEVRADEIHITIMNLPPKGITARSISECLLIQLSDNEHIDPTLINILKNDFDLLIHKKYTLLSQKYSIPESKIYEYKEIISRLDPKPGLYIASGRVNYIVPDLIIKLIDTEYEIIINDFSMPRISISKQYHNILQSIKSDRNAIQYVRSKINSAKFLIKSIYMRNRTLEKVMRSIINHQRDFFYSNSGLLEPLNYATIANELQVNESTISRVVKYKYADTPFGIFCLKDFFCSSAGKDKNYESVSRQRVQTTIDELVANEDNKNPLSDQDIVNILKERGIAVSRRVIAKYREEMKIPNSRFRRKL